MKPSLGLFLLLLATTTANSYGQTMTFSQSQVTIEGDTANVWDAFDDCDSEGWCDDAISIDSAAYDAGPYSGWYPGDPNWSIDAIVRCGRFLKLTSSSGCTRIVCNLIGARLLEDGHIECLYGDCTSTFDYTSIGCRGRMRMPPRY